MTTKDQVFLEVTEQIPDFQFGTTVANVFDDMVQRSVPCYGEIQRMIAELSANYAQAGTDVYDLGCATGTTLIGMNATIDPAIRFIGIDDSPEMLAKCQAKLTANGLSRPCELRVADLNATVAIGNASIAVLCLTLQFVRPLNRGKLLRSIFAGLVPGGALILVEKVLTENRDFNPAFIRYYHDYKRRNHYSELEIAQKREALENVLIPYKVSENLALLNEAGFNRCEVFFRWYNFCGMIAVKD